MIRPPSIRRFEQLWWGATALWLLGTLLSWNRAQASLAADPRAAPVAAAAQPAVLVFVVALTALGWWLVARRASPAGKWLVAAVAVISGLVALTRLGGLAMGRSPHPLSLLAFLAGEALTIAAALPLFRPEADEWFGLGGAEPLP